MSREIFLGGGGNQKASELLDNRFVEEINARKLAKLIYIPIALTSKPYSECLVWFNLVFGGRVAEIEMWDDLEGKTLGGMENQAALYIGGGNTVRLMESIVKSGLDKQIINFVRNDGLIYGGSAGAIILGSDIRTAPEAKNSKSFQGLGLVGNHSVACHYKPSQSADLINISNIANNKIIAIEENAGIIFDGKKMSPVGPGNSFLLNGKDGSFKRI